MDKRSCPYEASQQDSSKTRKTSDSYDHSLSRKEDTIALRDCSKLRGKDLINYPFRLKLSESRIKSIMATMNATHERTKDNNIPETNAYYPATLLKIGEYKVMATDEETLIVGYHYGRHKKFAWEILDRDLSIKYQIDVSCHNIAALQMVVKDNNLGSLEIELNERPSFYRNVNSRPQSHPKWEFSEDFTRGHALIYRRHYLEFRLEVLDKLYQKLIQYDSRLSELSHLPFPDSNSSFFVIESSNIHGMCKSQTNSATHEQPTLPILSPQQAGEFDNTIMWSSLPMHSTSSKLAIQSPRNNTFNNVLHVDPTVATRSQRHNTENNTFNNCINHELA
ncbi:hypothetical protein RJT34_12917 [Clitoria ternatea]|uniref:TRF2/HOY1 PH-like domain-containing protein n=1 Tax=Clitoria ternatea TaxID=43366 RepID=A0AAN9JQA1_CLITE